jgi:two-component system, OmpR family, response regulator
LRRSKTLHSLTRASTAHGASKVLCQLLIRHLEGRDTAIRYRIGPTKRFHNILKGNGVNSGDTARILVVDRDSTARDRVVRYLEEHDLRTASASGRQEMMRRLAAFAPRLVVLDLGIGPEDGLDLLREIRSRSDVPVIVTNCDRCDETDRVLGLELGADDYLIKPFGLRELMARIRAVLRRRETGPTLPKRDQERGGFRFGDWHLDRRLRRLTEPNGNPVVLTNCEYALLLAFLHAPQRPLTREHLLNATRVHEDVADRSIDVTVLRLRRKLQTDPSAPRVINTERGIGYAFALPVVALGIEHLRRPTAPAGSWPSRGPLSQSLR